MRFGLLLACIFSAATAFAQGVDYNRLDSEQQAVAADGIKGLCPANKEWFSSTSYHHPDGSFDPIWAKRQLLNKFTIQDIQQYGDLFTTMMAYQRMLNKGIRGEDRKSAPREAISTPEETKAEATMPHVARSKKDTDRSTKADRALAMHDATLKLQSQLEGMKKCARF